MGVIYKGAYNFIVMDLGKLSSILVNLMRISPHGWALFASGLTVLVHSYWPSESDSNYAMTTMIENSIGAGITALGAYYVKRELKRFLRLKRFVKDNGVSTMHIRKHMKNYCDRQAYKAVADVLGFRETYDQVAREFPRDQMNHAWMPSI